MSMGIASNTIQLSLPQFLEHQKYISRTVFKKLNVRSYLNLESTCRLLHQMLNDDLLWKSMCKRDFFAFSKPKHLTWKNFYKDFEDFFNIPYPGLGAIFQLKNEWSVKSIGFLSCELSFKSQTMDSLITEFKILGYENGKVGLIIRICKVDKFVQKYFQSIQLHDGEGALISEDALFYNPTNLQKIFKILKVYNVIPESHLPLLDKLIKTSDWRYVTSDEHVAVSQQTSSAIGIRPWHKLIAKFFKWVNQV